MIAQSFTKSFSDNLGQAIGPIVVMVILAFLALIAAIVIFGICFLVFSFIFYKKKKIKSFLVFGIIGSFFSSIGLSLVLSSIFFHNSSNVKFIMPVIFIVGVLIVVKFFKKSKQ